MSIRLVSLLFLLINLFGNSFISRIIAHKIFDLIVFLVQQLTFIIEILVKLCFLSQKLIYDPELDCVATDWDHHKHHEHQKSRVGREGIEKENAEFQEQLLESDDHDQHT